MPLFTASVSFGFSRRGTWVTLSTHYYEAKYEICLNDSCSLSTPFPPRHPFSISVGVAKLLLCLLSRPGRLLHNLPQNALNSQRVCGQNCRQAAIATSSSFCCCCSFSFEESLRKRKATKTFTRKRSRVPPERATGKRNPNSTKPISSCAALCMLRRRLLK